MTRGLSITIVDPDDDYTGIEIQACNELFSGTTRVYAGLKELSDFAERLVGFPSDHLDKRSHEFGSRTLGTAGGYCSLQFRCLDRAGHVALHVDLEEEKYVGWPHSSAQMSLQIEVAAIDRFIEALRPLDRERRGSAVLASS
jgi:hypothetical protein